MRVAVVWLLLLCVPAVARGETRWRAVARQVAVETWGQPPGCPVVKARRAGWVGREFGAAGYAVGCTIYISKPWDPLWVFYCDTFVHEWGHLMGLGHSADPGSLMTPGVDRVGPYWRCVRAAWLERMSGRGWPGPYVWNP